MADFSLMVALLYAGVLVDSLLRPILDRLYDSEIHKIAEHERAATKSN